MTETIRPDYTLLTPSPYDWLSGERFDRVFRMLVHAHGDERALIIIEGRDRAANADHAAWRKVGAR